MAGAMVGIVAGALCGLGAAVWILKRLNDRGVSLVLLTMGLLPVVGVAIHFAQVVAESWLHLRRLSRPRRAESRGVAPEPPR